MENDSEKPFENPYGYKVAIEEMERRLAHQFAGIDAMKATARQLLSSASLIVALLSSLQVFTTKVSPQSWPIYQLILSAAMLCYIGLIVCCIWAIKPLGINLPMEASWEALYEHLVAPKSELDVDKERLSAYLNVIDLNRPTSERQVKLVTTASWLLPVIVILLLSLSFIPR